MLLHFQSSPTKTKRLNVHSSILPLAPMYYPTAMQNATWTWTRNWKQRTRMQVALIRMKVLSCQMAKIRNVSGSHSFRRVQRRNANRKKSNNIVPKPAGLAMLMK